MYQSDTEILFPMRAAPKLRDLRGSMWEEIVDQACNSEDASPKQLALTLVMIRLAGCLTCHPDSYRAIRGCTICAVTTIRRFRGEDEDLEILIDGAKLEILAVVPQEIQAKSATKPKSSNRHREECSDEAMPTSREEIASLRSQ